MIVNIWCLVSKVLTNDVVVDDVTLLTLDCIAFYVYVEAEIQILHDTPREAWNFSKSYDAYTIFFENYFKRTALPIRVYISLFQPRCGAQYTTGSWLVISVVKSMCARMPLKCLDLKQIQNMLHNLCKHITFFHSFRQMFMKLETANIFYDTFLHIL